ncbi:MAG: hemolysin III family protein [Treponema sp.]|nr:hemolysin III family protein [Treponema sp.]
MSAYATDSSKRYTNGEEIVNAITHGIGAALSCAAIPLFLVTIVCSTTMQNKALSLVSASICGFCMFFLYMMSTMYHSLTPLRVKNVFGILDHCSIYVLIAGTYTPICLVGIGGPLGWAIFGIEWSFAALGCTFYSLFGSRMRWLSAVTYLPMAWAIVLVWKPFFSSVPQKTASFLFLGGAFYTIGFIFYALKSIKWMHGVFHVFCLAGSVFHFFSLLVLFKN